MGEVKPYFQCRWAVLVSLLLMGCAAPGLPEPPSILHVRCALAGGVIEFTIIGEQAFDTVGGEWSAWVNDGNIGLVRDTEEIGITRETGRVCHRLGQSWACYAPICQEDERVKVIRPIDFTRARPLDDWARAIRFFVHVGDTELAERVARVLGERGQEILREAQLQRE